MDRAMGDEGHVALPEHQLILDAVLERGGEHVDDFLTRMPMARSDCALGTNLTSELGPASWLLPDQNQVVTTEAMVPRGGIEPPTP
jgi:hypothetical protein